MSLRPASSATPRTAAPAASATTAIIAEPAERGVTKTVATVAGEARNPPTPPHSATPIHTEADVLETAATSVFGERYAGLSVTNGVFTVYVKGRLPKKLPAVFHDVGVKSVRYSLKELEAIKDRIGAHAVELGTHGVRLTTWGANPEHNVVAVRVSSDVPTARLELRRLLGSAPIAVAYQTPVEMKTG